MPSDEPPESSRAPTAIGFGKVLRSIQGLQQRLDDFSIDEVSRAHAKADALMQELEDFQSQLTALAKLKEAVASAMAQIGAIPEENFDLTGPDGLESHPQLRAIVQTGRLIRLHRSLREAQASAESSSLDLRHTSGASISHQEQEFPPSAGDAEAAIEHTAGGDNIQAEAKLAAVPSESALTPPSSTPAPAFKDPATCESAELKLETSSPPRDENCSPAAPPAAAGARWMENKNVVVKTDFDQRLLNDLIETYGEFAIAASAAKPTALATTISPQPLEDTPAPAHLISLQPMPAEPAFVRSTAGGLLTLPAPEKELTKPTAPGKLLSMKKQGELDRQLKRIIKDYGEYDLYSPQKSINIKMVAIVAFVLLGVVLGGFYFLKASPPVVPAAIEATPQAGTTEAAKGPRRNDSSEQPPGGAPNLK